MTTSDKHLLIKLGATAIAVYVLWRLSKPVRDTLTSVQNGLESTGEFIGKQLHDASQFIHGRGDVEFTQAGFVLDERYVASNGNIDEWWRKTMSDAHPDNAVLFRTITDRNGHLLPKYHHLIEKLVDATTI